MNKTTIFPNANNLLVYAESGCSYDSSDVYGKVWIDDGVLSDDVIALFPSAPIGAKNSYNDTLVSPTFEKSSGLSYDKVRSLKRLARNTHIDSNHYHSKVLKLQLASRNGDFTVSSQDRFNASILRRQVANIYPALAIGNRDSNGNVSWKYIIFMI